MDALRLALLILGVLLIAGIYFWDSWRRRRVRRRRYDLDALDEPFLDGVDLRSGLDTEPVAAELDRLREPPEAGGESEADAESVEYVRPIERAGSVRDSGAPASPADADRAQSPPTESPSAESPSAEPSSAQPSSAEPSSAERPAAQRPSAQPSSAQPSSAQRSSAQRPSAQAPSDQSAPARSRPAQPRPAQPRPAQSRPAQSRSAQSRPAQSRPVQSASSEKAASGSATKVYDGDQLIIALTVMAKGGRRIEGPALRAALEAEGLRFGDMDIFHHYGAGERTTTTPVFSVANVLEPGTFDADAFETFSTPGVCLFMKLPGEVEGSAALELMLNAGRRLAERLDVVLCDESRNVLTSQAVNHLRERITEFNRRQMLKAH